MAEKKRYGMLEMDDEQKKRLDKIITKKDFKTGGSRSEGVDSGCEKGNAADH